ncbi:Acyl-CoA synthetase family member 2 [Yarrowia sp. E02]|nr:Acyl-CoA synthetase family member 2 [Yarrowia sp. E02]
MLRPRAPAALRRASTHLSARPQGLPAVQRSFHLACSRPTRSTTSEEDRPKWLTPRNAREISAAFSRLGLGHSHRLYSGLSTPGVSEVTGGSSPALIESHSWDYFTTPAQRELWGARGEHPALISAYQSPDIANAILGRNSAHTNETHISFSELLKLSNLFADSLYAHARDQGLVFKSGDSVAVCAGNVWEYTALQMGLSKLGLVLVPLNPAFTANQFSAALEATEAKALIMTSHLPGGKDKASGKMTLKSAAPICQEVIDKLTASGKSKLKLLINLASGETPGADTIKDVKFQGSQSDMHDIVFQYQKAVAGGTLPASVPTEIRRLTATVNADDITNMQFTSGTTSQPKVSCLTHRNLLNNGHLIGTRMGLKPASGPAVNGIAPDQDRLCIPVPMFHCFGLVLSNLATLTTGAALVYPSEWFCARSAIDSVRKYKCTGLHGVPTMYVAELEYLKDLELKEGKGPGQNFLPGFELLRTGIAAGSAVPGELMTKLSQSMNLNALTICYGMTETAPVTFMTRPDDPVEKRVDSVGQIMPHTSCRIIRSQDEDLCESEVDFTPLATGEKGEIITSGYSLQKYYKDDPKKTSAAMVVDPATGVRWMRTGDEGCMDDGGYLKVTGRLKDLIIRGGENIHPLEIENVLFAHDKIAQASVVGVKDPKYGEAVCAFITPHAFFHEGHKHTKHDDSDKLTIEQVQEWVRNKLGHYMVPKYVFFVGDYPKTASGKIRKVDLRKSAELQLGLC